MFTSGKRLATDGLFWLKVHAANTLSGMNDQDLDKLTVDERHDWVDDNLVHLCKMGNAPTEITDWMEADSPWEALASIIELADAHKLKDPRDYVSNLPISFDATCSGLQMMSMLTRDEKTGELCNLVPDKPLGDNYLRVGEYVWDKLKKMEKTPDVLFWLNLYKKRRSTVKRSCMVFIYGGTTPTFAEHLYSDHKYKLAYNGITK
ncbi:MAG: hypothetical protein MPK62_12875, partial [Alphaproteobacteria bacterium]|nr:hypothetical protein [Alphaproteobacteria bacterium]